VEHGGTTKGAKELGPRSVEGAACTDKHTSTRVQAGKELGVSPCWVRELPGDESSMGGGGQFAGEAVEPAAAGRLPGMPGVGGDGGLLSRSRRGNGMTIGQRRQRKNSPGTNECHRRSPSVARQKIAL